LVEKKSTEIIQKHMLSHPFITIFVTPKSMISFRMLWVNLFTTLPLLKPTGDYSIA